MRRTEYLKIIDELNRYSRLYYEKDISEISDEEYDRKYEYLKTIEAKYPELKVDYSPTQRVGSPITSLGDRKTRTKKMASLDNAFTFDDFQAFTSTLFDNELAVELKLDGASLELVYIYGELVEALTRGDGMTGEVVTHAARAIRSVPLHIEDWTAIERVEIRGEVVMPFTAVEDYRKKHPEKEIISPRNLASGGLRLLDPKRVAERRLVFIPHSLGVCSEPIADDFVEFNKKCKALGFRTVTTQLCRSPQEVETLYNRFVQYRSKMPFAADGIVIKVNAFNRQDFYGETIKYPKWAIAWKFPAEEKETILRSVEFQVGRSGVVTPVAIFDKVVLSGAVVTNATLHNFKDIKRKDIQIGDTIVVTRSGDVIPKVLRSLPEKRTYYSKLITPPEVCPICNTILKEEKAYLICTNYACEAQIIGRILHFASRNAMDIRGLGDSMAEFLHTKGYVKKLSDIYALDFDKIIAEEGKPQIFQNLKDSIEKSREEVDFGKLLYGLGIRGVGEVQAQEITKFLASKHVNLTGLFSDIELCSFLTEIDGIGTITAEAIKAYVITPELSSEALNIIEAQYSFKEIKAVCSNKLKDLTFVITGGLKIPRKNMEYLIKEHGGRVTTSVSKKTSYLIVGEEPGNDKLTGAKKNNIPQISEEQLNEMIK